MMVSRRTLMLVEHPRILKPEESYTFHDYFKLNFDAGDILSDLGCQLIKAKLDLPHAPWDVEPLKAQMREYLDFVTVDSEDARKQTLISPLLLKLVGVLKAHLKIEYTIRVNQYLKGTLDYYLNNGRNLLVVEAKNADLSRGFVQMAVELIALNLWLRDSRQPLVGAVTTGEIWQFGRYDPTTATITQDTQLYLLLDHLTELAAILKGVLTQPNQSDRMSTTDASLDLLRIKD